MTERFRKTCVPPYGARFGTVMFADGDKVAPLQAAEMLCWNIRDHADSRALGSLRIPSDADQRSDLMAIAIPVSCRSPFQSDGDHRSKPMPITRRVG
jgi:hypothetical protein